MSPPQVRQLSDSQRLAYLSGRAPCSVFERLLRLSPGLCKYAQPRSAHGQMSVHSKIGRWFWRPAIRICRTHTRLRSGCSRLGRRSKRMWMSSAGTRRFRSGQTGGVYKCDGNSAWIGPRSPEPDTGRNRMQSCSGAVVVAGYRLERHELVFGARILASPLAMDGSQEGGGPWTGRTQ